MHLPLDDLFTMGDNVLIMHAREVVACGRVPAGIVLTFGIGNPECLRLSLPSTAA